MLRSRLVAPLAVAALVFAVIVLVGDQPGMAQQEGRSTTVTSSTTRTGMMAVLEIVN
jgi:hypothetical protein